MRLRAFLVRHRPVPHDFLFLLVVVAIYAFLPTDTATYALLIGALLVGITYWLKTTLIREGSMMNPPKPSHAAWVYLPVAIAWLVTQALMYYFYMPILFGGLITAAWAGLDVWKSWRFHKSFSQ